MHTVINCDAAGIKGLFGTTWLTLLCSGCINFDPTLFISVPLPHQYISVNVLLGDVKTIGGLCIGLYGDQHINESYTLKKLYFYKSFYKNGYVLGRNIPLSLTLTKLINETVSMNNGSSGFTGVFIPTFSVDLNNILLLLSDEYIFSGF